ncbi:nuclear transport factor 2 family protein [Hyphococcus luteus]|uniref:nuclear transport factor 2 family protein n=1 Tax=Hyphococcus luteus TaxID=2058213 RepID=UPI001A9C35DE|nr:nuclear transport factor 2 family protein [Marinicaulis flavus]
MERLESLRAVKDLQRHYAQYEQYSLWGDMAALFAKDARVEWGDEKIDGRDAISDWLNEGGDLAPGALNTEFIDEPLVNLSVDGDSAKGRWMSLAFKGDGQGRAWFEGGLYENDYVREDGVWKIAVMRYYPQYEGDYAEGWKNVGGEDIPIIPYHFTIDETGVPIPEPEGDAPESDASLDSLEQRIAAMNDEDDVRNLQNAYGYYVDRKMWDDVVDLFAEDSAVEIAGAGVFKGPEGVREAMELMGPAGLGHGELNEHPLFDTLVRVVPDGNEAETRGIELAMLGDADEDAASWKISVYRNRFVKEGGIWKFKEMRLYPMMKADYDEGWGSGEGVEHRFPAFLSPNPGTGSPVDVADFMVVAKDDLTGTVDQSDSGEETAQAPEDRLVDLRRRLKRSEAYDAVVNVSAAYGYYLDDFQWTKLSSIFAEDGNKQSPFAGFYLGQDRIMGAANAMWGPPREMRPAVSFHWRTQPVIHVSHDGRSANLRTRLFQPRTSKDPDAPSRFYMGGLHGGMYPNDQLVLENGVWRFWSLTIDEHYFAMPNWEDGWSGAEEPEAEAEPYRSPLLDKYPPDILLTELGERQEGFRGGTGETVDWPGILPMWFHYRNPVSGRTPEHYWPDCVPCEKLSEARLTEHGYEMPPTGPEIDGVELR